MEGLLRGLPMFCPRIIVVRSAPAWSAGCHWQLPWLLTLVTTKLALPDGDGTNSGAGRRAVSDFFRGIHPVSGKFKLILLKTSFKSWSSFLCGGYIFWGQSDDNPVLCYFLWRDSQAKSTKESPSNLLLNTKSTRAVKTRCPKRRDTSDTSSVLLSNQNMFTTIGFGVIIDL